MALEPITSPDVAQSGGPVGPSPIPNAFGATVLGQGLEGAGKTAEGISSELGQTAVHLQTLYNDAEVANRSIAAFDQGSQLGSQFRELRMNAAVQGYGAFRAGIEKIIQNGAQGLPPAALPQYMQQTRRFLAGELNSAASHVAQQGTAYTTASTIAGAQTAGQAYTANPTPEMEANFHNELGKYVAMTAKQNGLDPFKPEDSALLRQDALKITSKPYYDVASSMIARGGDLSGAGAYLAAHRQDIDPDHIRELDNAMALRTNANNVYSAADIAWHGGAFGQTPDFDHFWRTFEVPHEGSALVTDSNGAKVRYGINQADNPNVDVANMSQDQAGAIFKKDYTQNGLPAALAYAHADTAFLAGKPKADELLNEAGGDVSKYLDLRAQFLSGLVQQDPAKYGKYAEVWAARTNDLRAYVGGLPSGPAGVLAGMPPPKSTDDPDQYEANALTRVNANLQVMYPQDSAEREKALRVADQNIKLAVAPLREQAKATLNALTSDAIQQGYGTFEQIQAAHPAEVASLPGTYQKTLMGSVGSIGNQPTTQRLGNEQAVTGRLAQLGDNPNAMDGVNLDTLDLTNSARQRLGDLLAKYKNGTWKPDSTADRIAGSVLGKQALQSVYAVDFQGVGHGTPQEQQAGINYEAHKARFIGALSDQVSAWRAQNPNKELSDSDVSQLVANVSAQVSGHLAGVGFAIRPEDLPTVDSRLRKAGWAVTDYNRGRAYDMMRRSGEIK